MTDVYWQPDLRSIAKAADGYGKRVLESIWQMVQDVAVLIEQYAKVHAPWRNVTGQARATLHSWAEETARGWIITLAHGVFYGIYLEQRGYGIIGEALEAHYAIIMQRLRRILGDR